MQYKKKKSTIFFKKKSFLSFQKNIVSGVVVILVCYSKTAERFDYDTHFYRSQFAYLYALGIILRIKCRGKKRLE